jgi:ribonuclease R
LPTPGEAEAKLSKRLASRVKEPTQTPKKISADELAWQAAGLHCSANERRADEASRDVEAWLKCKYMREHLGEEFGGVVTAATGFGIFVTLDAMYVEGLVHITELGSEYFRFDEARQELRGERSGMRYAIGTRVRVQVSRVDLDGRKIDFRLVHEGEDLLGRAMKDKTGGHAAELPAQERAAPRHAGGKGAGKGRGESAGKRSKSQSSGRSAATDRTADRTPKSPIQALKAAVKKSTSNPGRKQGKTPRR